MTIEYRRMAQLRGSEADWTANDVVLLAGEIALQIGPGLGEARAKVGDGATAFSGLPWVFEVDQTARDQIGTLDGTVIALDSRVTVLEDQLAAGGSMADLIAQVDQNTSDIAGKQAALPLGANPGDVVYWDGSAFATTAFSPPASLGTMFYWDAAAGAYLRVPNGAVGQALILQPGGAPGWGNPSTITVTVANSHIPLAGGAAVEDAFNAAAPTIAPDATVTVSWESLAYHYVGAPGIAITTATAADFAQIGILAATGVEEAPLDGLRYARQSGVWVALPPPTFHGVFAITGAAQMVDVPVPFDSEIPADLAGTQFSIDANPSASTAFDLRRNGVSEATLTIETDGSLTLSTQAAIPLVAGDALTVVAPADLHGMARVTFTIPMEG